jgi:hypothetical protein
MSDLWLSTKLSPTNIPPQPLPEGQQYYFGDMSNDLQVNPVADLFTVSGAQKLAQDIQKILLTVQGTNVFFPLYGTNLQNYIGQKMNDQSVVSNIRTEVVNAMNVLNFIRQGAPANEIPDTLQYLSVAQSDPLTITITLTVISASGESVTTSVLVTPNP